MMELLLALLTVVGSAAVATGGLEPGIFPEYLTISAPLVKLASTESIYSFSLDTIGAVIVRMDVPVMWDVKIDNSEGARSHLRAHAIVGAYAFGGKSLGYFRDFVEIGKYDPNPSLVPEFDVKLVVGITDDSTGKERSVVLPLAQMTLTRRKPRAGDGVFR
jgi:hypothetical protein